AEPQRRREPLHGGRDVPLPRAGRQRSPAAAPLDRREGSGPPSRKACNQPSPRGMLSRPCSVDRSKMPMSEETLTPRISTAPAIDHGSDGEMAALRKEVIEARNLVIKTD